MSTKLTPTVVTEATMGDTAFDGVRRRPVVALNDDGQLVVCCRRTAKTNGWTVEGTLHQRTRSTKTTPEPVEPVKAVKAVKAADTSVEDLL